jgi:hypothetical protein
MVDDALLRAGRRDRIVRLVKGPGRWTSALVLAATLGALLASCSSGDGDAGDADAEVGRPDRGAQEQGVRGWEVEFVVKIANASSKPLEVGVSHDPQGRFEQLISSVDPTDPTYSRLAVIQPQGAGSVKALVVPASPDGTTEQELDLLVQQKIGTDSTYVNSSQSQPAGATQDLMIVLPTIQLRFRTDYVWELQRCTGQVTLGSKRCTWERKATVNIQTRGGDGYQRHYQDMQYCYDPTRLPNFGSEIGDPAQYWNAVPAERISTITIDVRGAADMAKPCTTTPEGQPPKNYPAAFMPGMSLSPGDNPGPGLNLARLRLADAQMPGIDLRKANLTASDFSGTRRANLAYAQLDGTSLGAVNFSDAILVGASFDGATLVDAKGNAALFPGAVLTDVDLSKTTGALPWNNISTAKFCRTTLPESTLQEYRSKNGGEDPDLNAACGDKLSSIMGASGGNVMLVDTSSMVPLTLLLQSGSFDCPMPSAVGSFGAIPHPAPTCWGYYGSSRLIDSTSLDDDTSRTTTTIAGRQPPPDIVHDGGFTLASAGPTSPVDGLSISSGPLTNGWTGIACLAVLHDRTSGTCKDEHVPLPSGP